MKWTPKFSLPKFSWPRIALPKPRLPQFAPPSLALLKNRKLVIGASVLALIVAGGLAWFFVRPLLAGPEARQTAANPAPGAAAPTAPEQAQAAAPEKTAGQEARTKDEEKRAAETSRGTKDEEKQAAAPLPPPAPLDEPEILIRRLQDLQERVAGGDAASYTEQPRLLHEIARRFEAQPPDIWAKKQDARALILYLLSGGASTVGRAVLGAHSFAPTEAPLAKGAIAYLEGVEGSDRDALLALDPLALDYSLGAHVAFVQSILLAGSDPAKAIAKLDLARLLAPGGLVEEAALRREIGLLAETSDFDKFAQLARQYWERFRASPYAENFLRQFLFSVARVSLRIHVSEWAQLDEFINSLKPETRRALYLVVAQNAAVGGNFPLGEMAAGRALELAPDRNAPDRQRALLYRAASRVGSVDAAQAPALLREVDRARLPPGDQPIHDAVALAAARMFRAPETRFAAPPPGPPDAVDAALARAEASVTDADAALDAARRSMERKTR
jgi:chemotaxis protein MotC